MAPVGMFAVIWMFGEPGVAGSPDRLAAQPPWSILPSGETRRAIRPCARSTPPGLAGSWTPKADNVISAEARVDEAIAASVKTSRKDLTAQVPLQYCRQYVGTFLAGRRILYVTGLSRPMVDLRPRVFRWRSKAFAGCDFGVRAFGAAYDVNSQRFVSFDFDY
jgi:hypothetical protein